MARAKFGRLRGIEGLRAAILRADPEIRDEAMEEVENSTRRMLSNARSKLNSASNYAAFWHGRRGMQTITGQFRRYYRRSLSKAKLSGKVGILSKATMRRMYYVRFFNDGTINQPARPFHDEAFEEERDIYIENQTRMLRRVLNKIF